MGKEMRLDKLLAEVGVGTRSQIKDMAKKGRIRVNGAAEKKTDRKVNPEQDEITIDHLPVVYAETEYYMLNKPQGVVSATEDSLHKTVLDLLKNGPDSPVRTDLFPVGRLDLDTEGLLLITNDGELAHNLLSPKRHVDKRYYAKVEGELPLDAAEQFGKGITLLDGTRTMAARLEILEEYGTEESPGAEIVLTIHEGKFHQVKRMFEALGCKVAFLKRLSMGSLMLDESLSPGEFRRLSREEVEALRGLGESRE